MNKREAVLVIDVGLTNCKVSVFDAGGHLIAQESQAYPTHSLQVGWSEQHPEDWWAALKKGIQALHSSPAMNAMEIHAIIPTAHMHAMLALGPNCEPLTTCWTLFDQRAQVQAQRLQSEVKNIYERTGARLEPYTPAAKIAWLKQNQPDVFRQATYFVSPKDAIRVMLGGEPVTDPIDAAGMLLYNIQNQDWDVDILEVVGVDREQLPEVRESTEPAGMLSEDAAQEFGLQAGIPLLVGAGDDIEALGAGVVQSGQTLEHIGTTGTLISCVPTTIFDPAQRIEIYPHALRGRYLLGGATNAAGKSLNWAKNLLGMNANTADLPLMYPPVDGAPGAPIYLPYISGERGLLWDANATGAFLGLRHSHTASDIAYAVYEGVVLSMKEILSANMRLGVNVSEIISGTPDTNQAWLQMRSDAYGIPIAFPNVANLTGLGSALLALVGLGIIETLQQAVAQCCTIAQRVMPNPERTAHFTKRFELYQQAIETNRALLSQI